ncbi:L,D-transpeptidase [Actinophytocola sp.]|uniref:L,D-transpeptidase n=1 Tax=Actinophytocola sp. TaxID=1872138 RepID=UPI002EDAFF5E
MARVRIAVLAGLLGLTAAACTAQAEPAAAPPPVTTTTTPPPTTATTTTTTAPPPPPCAPTVRACVSLSAKRAWLVKGGVADYGPVPISHGSPTEPTPTGTYPVSWKDQDNTSSVYGTPMPYSVFFAPGGIAFHGGDTRTDSHGCVHLTIAAAQVFFARLRPGEIVQVLP